jgi:hypothetical protein
VAFNQFYAECHYSDGHYAECHYAEGHYAEGHYAECRGPFQAIEALFYGKLLVSLNSEE